MRTRTRQTGDTIVEVLISTAIISIVLTSSFIVSQQSGTAVADSRERNEATQLLQGQVELVRDQAIKLENDTTGVYYSGLKYFCIDSAIPGAPVPLHIPFDADAISDLSNEDFSKYPAACKSGPDGRYHTAILYDAASKTFRFNSRWEKIGGGKDQIVFSYRIYPGQVSLPPPGAGVASIDEGLCDTATTPPCPGPPVGGSYHYDYTLINNSVNAPSNIAGCKWTWGDGTSNIMGAADPSCQNGNNSPTHIYPTLSPEPPYPAACIKTPGSTAWVVYTVSLTMYLNNTPVTPTDTRDIVLPNCY